MADTVVQYILNVDTDRAEKGLRDTSQEAKQTSTQFDRVAASSTGLNSGLKRTERQVVSTTKRFRQMRRAGRDLDGAFSDLGQGLSIVSPAAGNLFMTLSDGASIAEGLGRSLTLFVNPAFVAVAGVTALAAGALFLYQEEQKRVEEEAKQLKDALDASTKAVQDQEKAFGSAEQKLAGYVTSINDARLDMLLLTGAVSQFEADQAKATLRAEEFRQQSNKALDDQIASQDVARKALKDQITIAADAVKLAEERAKKNRAISDAIAGAELQLDKQGRLAKEQLADAVARLDALDKQKDEIEEQRKKISGQARELEQILQTTAEINEKRRERAEDDRKAADAERRRREAERDAERRAAAAQKERNEKAAKLQQLLDLQNNALLATSSESEKIRRKFQSLIDKAEELGKETGNQVLAQEAIDALLKQQAQELAAINKEEKTRTNELDRQATIISSIQSSIGALQSPEALVGSIGSAIQGVGALVKDEDKSKDIIALGGSPELAVATALIQSVAGLGSSVQGAIDEAAADGITLNEEQARRVVLGNMNEAFQNFTRDLERGLALLPQIIIDILPEFVVTLAKVISVDLPKFLMFELPLALIRSIPEIIIAVINEIGFIFADIVNKLISISDQLLNLIQAISTPEGRQQARSDSISNAGDRIAARFDGITSARDAFSDLDSRVRPRGGLFFAGGGRFIPQAQGGMRFTGSARSGLAMLHQNEFVVPASGQRPQTVDRQMSSMSGGINIVINSPVVEQNAVDALVRRIEERFNSNFGLSSSNLFGGR